MTELNPLTYNEYKVNEAAFQGYQAGPNCMDVPQSPYANPSASIA